jgi:hypothetical protein
MATLEDFFPKKSFAPFILYIFGHHGIKLCPKTKNTGFNCSKPGKKRRKKVARLLYFASVGSQKYKMMIKNSCFIFGLWPDLAKSL